MYPLHRVCRHAALLPCFALLAGCDDPATAPRPVSYAPQLAVVTNERFPFAFTVAACNGELVDISGTSQHVVTQTTTPSGNEHVTDHITTRGTGIGQTTGARYLLREVATRTQTIAGPLPETFTFEDTGGLIGQGGAADLRFKLLFHVTVNANGETTVEIGRFELLCK